MTTGAFIADILRWFIGYVWLAAGIGKLRAFAHFRANLLSSFGVPAAAAALVAPGVIATELLLAALVLGRASRAAMLFSLFMLCGLTAVLSYKYFTQPVVRCSCFGEALRPVSGRDLVRNALVALAGGACLALAPALPLHASLPGAGLAAILCVAAIEFHDIVDLSKAS